MSIRIIDPNNKLVNEIKQFIQDPSISFCSKTDDISVIEAYFYCW